MQVACIGDDNMKLSEEIKRTRQKALLSQNDFAEALSLSPSTIARWETARVRPTITAMKRIKSFCEANQLPFNDIENAWLNEENTI